MIKAVVFDMGGVIFRLNVPQCLNRFKTEAGFEDIEDFINIYQQQGFIGEFEAGKIDEDQFYAAALSHSRPGTTRETIHNCFCSLLDGTNEDAVELIRSLRGKYKLYLLSNNNPISLQLLGEVLAEQGLPRKSSVPSSSRLRSLARKYILKPWKESAATLPKYCS